MANKNEPLVFERSYNAPPEKVWKALTDEKDMKHWYFDLPGFKAEVGYKFTFKGGPDDGIQYVHLCEIKEVIPFKKISYTWRYEGYEGDSLVSFELFADGNKTKLKLTHRGLDTFPANNKDFAKENFVTGWTMIIGTSLKDFVEKK